MECLLVDKNATRTKSRITADSVELDTIVLSDYTRLCLKPETRVIARHRVGSIKMIKRAQPCP
jgi:hypothetical protein